MTRGKVPRKQQAEFSLPRRFKLNSWKVGLSVTGGIDDGGARDPAKNIDIPRPAWESTILGQFALLIVSKIRTTAPIHKNHVANAIGKAQTQHEERLGETLLDEMRRVQRKAWELLARTESDGDHRGSIVALREVRECLESLGVMLAKADTASGGSAQHEHFDFSVLSDDELSALEALLAKAAGRPAWKPELLQPETLARITRG